jgi:hypothetical protein
MEVELHITPREQLAGYLSRQQRWACMVLHRRAGKSYVCIQDLILRALTHKRQGPPLRYAYLAPTLSQVKDIAFGYLVAFTAGIPGVEINRAELSVTFHNRASIRLYSGEAFERLRGIYLDGCVLDEYADIDPAAWDTVIRPCLSDYIGWATFVGTPKGKANGFYKAHKAATAGDPDWFSLLLRASESGIIPDSELRDIRKGTSEHAYSQEYECDFNIGRPGAIYSRVLDMARVGGRVTANVLWFKELPVYTAFDVGAAHNQKVWIFQIVGDRINFLEALSGSSECATPADWAARLRAKHYQYGAHFLPHDACAENGGLWQQALQTAGLSHIVGVPRQVSVWDGINLALDAFPRTFINSEGCADGIDALDAYHSKEERDGVTIKNVPVHDWASHYSDSFALAHQAINRGMCVDRSAIPSKPRMQGAVRVISGIRDGGGSGKVLR